MSWLTPLKKSGQATLRSEKSGAPLALKKTAQSKSGASAASSLGVSW